ncbi:MAG: hypothetical protein EZS28_037506 [Streblomastix strix]|uniref:Uncharacterized protein n=1 Tax=Streblomastix strix TaxID=222440 RepID=A0A5J4U7W3_9EUKA|nr:MAG: hypothetical protein EZS28_037506 [Streblomastix strix]
MTLLGFRGNTALTSLQQSQGPDQYLDIDAVTELVTTMMCEEAENPMRLLVRLVRDEGELFRVVTQKIQLIIT